MQAFAVAGHGQQALTAERARPVLDVFWQVDHDRSGPAGAGDFKRGANGNFQSLRVRDQESVLGHRAQATADRRFLERVRADGLGRNLPADHDQGR